MLTYSLENTGGVCLYEYLYNCIKSDILNGVLAAGAKLPSKRTFAKNLNVSTVTIENAYSQLMAEGYIYSISKRGYFVADLPSGNVHKRTVSSYDNKNNSKHDADLNATAPLYADFISGKNLNENFPFTVWSKLLREVMSERSELLMTNSVSGGIMLLRESIAKHLYEFRGMRVLPEQIIIGAGTEYLYGLIILLLGRDKVFAMENPGYKKISQVYLSNNVKLRYISLDNNGISMDMLRKSNADILHISPSHHYPTGLITPITRRREILDWAYEKEERYIIEDDYDCEFRMAGIPIPTLQSIDVCDRVIYMNTFTKSLASTIRISYMVLPMGLIDKFYANLGFYSCTVSTFEQLTLYKFMSEGHFEKHINRMRNFYKNQRNLILNAIKSSPLNKFCTIKEQNAGLHFLMSVDTKLSEGEMLKRAEKLGIRIGFLSGFYFNTDFVEDKEHTLVINYSGIEPDRIEHGIELLCKCIIL